MKFIINADDFAGTEERTRAIDEAFLAGCLSRASIIVNKDPFEQAVRISEERGYKDKIGLHLNLTTGFPLTEDIRHCRAFCGEDGKFNRKLFHSRRTRFWLTPKEKRAVKKEIEAQVDKYLEFGFSLMNADGHGHIHTFFSFARIIIPILKEKEFKSVRLSKNVPQSGRKDSLLKSIYKKQFNNYIRKNFKDSTLYFGAVTESMCLANSEEGKREGVCEVMTHPIIIDGKIQIDEQQYDFDDLSALKNR